MSLFTPIRSVELLNEGRASFNIRVFQDFNYPSQDRDALERPHRHDF